MTDHALKLSRGARNVLSRIVATTALKKPDDIVRVGAFTDNHLMELGEPPKDSEAAKAWMREMGEDISVNEKTRTSLRSLLSAAAEQGTVAGTPAAGELFRVLGFED